MRFSVLEHSMTAKQDLSPNPDVSYSYNGAEYHSRDLTE